MKLSYKIKFIDTARFTQVHLSSLVDNLKEGNLKKLNVKILFIFLNSKVPRKIQ